MSSTVDALRIVVKTGGSECLSQFLQSCDESRVFSQSKDAASVVALTNQLLNENSTRREGLMVMKCLVAQLPTEELRANFLSWLQQTIRGLSQKDSTQTVVLSAEVMNSLIAVSPLFVDIRKEIAFNLSKKIFEVLYELKDSLEFSGAILTPLYTFLDKYGKGATSYKDKLDKYLLSLIEADGHLVYLASRCYLCLAKCGIPGNDSIFYKEGWLNQFKSLISSLHTILDRLFENFNEIDRSGRSSGAATLQHLPKIDEIIPARRMHRLTSQYLGLSQFVETMLLGPFPVPKRVSPDLVFGVVCRGLAVTVGTLRAQVTSDTEALIAQIPRLHTACLSLLKALIKSCRTNLISFGPVICKLISQVLKTRVTGANLYGHHKPYRSIRKAAYDCLISWLSVANCSSTIENYPDVIESIVSDVQYKPPAVTLNMSCKMLKGKMGKKQRQTLINNTLDSGEVNLIDKEANKEVCVAALQTIPLLLESASIFLPSDSYKILQDVVCNELLSTHLNTGEKIPLPYADNGCRLELYKCFVAFCHHNHPSFSPPIAMAHKIIGQGQTDSCDEIVQFCTMALTTLDKILRPIGPSLYVPIELPNTAFKTNRVNFELPLIETPKESDQNVLVPASEETEDQDGNSRSPVNSTLEDSLLVDSEMSEFDYSDNIKDNPSTSTVIDAPTVKSSNIYNDDSIESKRKLENDEDVSEHKRIKNEHLPLGDLQPEVSSTVNNPVTDPEPTKDNSPIIPEDTPAVIVTKDITSSSNQQVSDSLPSGIASKDDSNKVEIVDDLEAEMLSSFVDDIV